MMADKNRLLLFSGLLLVVISGAMQTHRLELAGLASEDDFVFDLQTQDVLREGWGEYGEASSKLAAKQGRFYFLLSSGFFLLPYLAPAGVWRAALVTSFQFGAIAALVLFLRRYLSSQGSIWLGGMLCALLPLWRHFHPLTATPVYYHAAMLVFFGSLLLRARTRRTAGAARHLYLAGLFCSLMFYEILLLPYLLIALLDEWAELPEASGGERWRRRARSAAPVVAVFAAWIGIYVVYRLLHPSIYEGSRMAPLSVGATLGGLKAFLARAIPGMNLAVQYELLPEVMQGYLPVLGFRRILLGHLTGWGWAQALAALGLGGLYGWSLAGRGARGGSRFGRVLPAGVCAGIAVMLPLPLMMTVKYRDAAAGWAPYIPGYYVYLALMAAVALGLDRRGGGGETGRSATIRWGAAAALGGMCFGAVAATFIANEVVAESYARPARKWRQVDLALRGKALERLPKGSTVYAPALWEEFPKADWMPYEEYWSQYIEKHGGGRVKVVRVFDRASLSGGAVYYAEPLEGGCAGEGLMVSRLAGVQESAAGMVTEETLVVSQRAPNGCVLEAIAAGAEGEARVGDPRVEVQVPRAEVREGVFVAQFQTPGIVAGSGRLGQPARLKAVEVEFGAGFSGRERDSRDYWVWSDGASGEGELNLKNNAGAAVGVRLRFTLMTGQAEKARFEVEGAGLRGGFMLRNREEVEWKFRLEPGDNRVRIRSEGRRVQAPGDGRHLVFGLRNYEFQVLGQ